MGYEKALEAAGAKVIDFKMFGSYQGTWIALVEYNNQIGLVDGSFGSCSGCDVFQAEFDYSEPETYNGKYYKNGYTWDEESAITKEEYEEELKIYNQKLADFGKSYLATVNNDKAIIEIRLSKLKEEDWFDEEERESLEWSLEKLNRITS